MVSVVQVHIPVELLFSQYHKEVTPLLVNSSPHNIHRKLNIPPVLILPDSTMDNPSSKATLKVEVEVIELGLGVSVI